MSIDVETIYAHFKKGPTRYDEDTHSKLLIKLFSDKDTATMNHFCVEAMISEGTFWKWTREYTLFGELYSFCKLLARKIWENEGLEFRHLQTEMGMVSHAFEYWKLIGWSRFGVSKNSRIKLNLDPNANPSQHYSQLLKQASEGDFTAAEIKQLMEAVNVGLNTYQVFELQKEIDQLKSDLGTMAANSNVKDTFTNKGTA